MGRPGRGKRKSSEAFDDSPEPGEDAEQQQQYPLKRQRAKSLNFDSTAEANPKVFQSQRSVTEGGKPLPQPAPKQVGPRRARPKWPEQKQGGQQEQQQQQQRVEQKRRAGSKHAESKHVYPEPVDGSKGTSRSTSMNPNTNISTGGEGFVTRTLLAGIRTSMARLEMRDPEEQKRQQHRQGPGNPQAPIGPMLAGRGRGLGLGWGRGRPPGWNNLPTPPVLPPLRPRSQSFRSSAGGADTDPARAGGTGTMGPPPRPSRLLPATSILGSRVGTGSLRSTEKLPWDNPFTNAASLGYTGHPGFGFGHYAAEFGDDDPFSYSKTDTDRMIAKFSRNLEDRRLQLRSASQKLQAAVGARNKLPFKVPPIPPLDLGQERNWMEENQAQNGAGMSSKKAGKLPLRAPVVTCGDSRNNDLLERLFFWATKTGRLARVSCESVLFEKVEEKIPISSAEVLGPLNTGEYGTCTAPRKLPRTVTRLKYLDSGEGGKLMMYRGDIPDQSGKPHAWIWFEIQRPVITRPPPGGPSAMPPSLDPMPQSMLVFALPMANALTIHEETKMVKMRLSRDGVPSVEFSRDREEALATGIVYGDGGPVLPLPFLCVKRVDWGAVDTTDAKSEPGDGDDGEEGGARVKGEWDTTSEEDEGASTVRRMRGCNLRGGGGTSDSTEEEEEEETNGVGGTSNTTEEEEETNRVDIWEDDRDGSEDTTEREEEDMEREEEDMEREEEDTGRAPHTFRAGVDKENMAPTYGMEEHHADLPLPTWDSWWDEFGQKCKRDAEKWQAIWEDMALNRVELTVVAGYEGWMSFDGREWKPIKRGPAGRGPTDCQFTPPTPRTPTRFAQPTPLPGPAVGQGPAYMSALRQPAPRRRRSSGLRNELSVDEDENWGERGYETDSEHRGRP